MQFTVKYLFTFKSLDREGMLVHDLIQIGILICDAEIQNFYVVECHIRIGVCLLVELMVIFHSPR